MQFKNNRAVGMTFAQAKYQRGTITPSLVIVHDTASRLTELSAARYLQNNTAKVSVHFVVERSGVAQQQVALNRGANHAGRSEYNGRSGCNDFSIGIEIVNPGRMTFAGEGKSRAWYGEVFDNAEHGIQRISTPQHGDHWWMPYTEAQISTVLDLCHGLFAYKGSLIDIQPHWFVSPGRKVDTNPLFPLAEVRAQVLGRSEPSEDAADAGSVPPKYRDEWVVVNTPGNTLSLRRWPSFNPNVIASIPHGTQVPLIRVGSFLGHQWFKVAYGGQSGWIVARYTSQSAALENRIPS